MFDLKLILIAVGASFSIGSLASWWLTADFKESKYQAIISQMQIDGQKAIQESMQKALIVERENNRLATEIEVQGAKNRQKIDELYADNLRLVDERAGLFDSRATPSDCSVPANATTTPKPAAATSCARLSNSLTQLLLTESKRADEAANYAMTCYEWVKKLGVK
jgi:hypothetical protein